MDNEDATEVDKLLGPGTAHIIEENFRWGQVVILRMVKKIKKLDKRLKALESKCEDDGK